MIRSQHDQREAMARRLRQIPALAEWVRWAAAVVLVVGLLLWLVLFAPGLLVPSASDASLRDVTDAAKRHELQDNRLKLQNDVRTTLLQGVGGLALLIGAFFTYRQVQTNRRQLEVAQQGQVTERFTRAIDQLGHENLDVRLGGIYALERIANDSPQDRPTVAAVLTAFLRGHTPWPPTPSPYGDDVFSNRFPSLQGRMPDAQASLTVLGRRKTPNEREQELDLRATDLRKANMRGAQLERAILLGTRLQMADLADSRLRSADLRGAQLQKATLTGAQLQGADLTGASLDQATVVSAQLQKATLVGAKLDSADLTDAQLQGANLADAQLRRATLLGAGLQDAILTDVLLQDAMLLDAQLQGATLIGARLQESALMNAQLQDADLGGAQLQNAHLQSAQMLGANLRGAQFQGAIDDRNTVWPVGFDWKAAGVVREGD